MFIKGFEFSLRELAVSVSDFGTLVPLTVGYSYLWFRSHRTTLRSIRLTNIFLALIYRLPLLVQPKKAIGSLALSEKWPMNKVLGTGFSVGLMDCAGLFEEVEPSFG